MAAQAPSYGGQSGGHTGGYGGGASYVAVAAPVYHRPAVSAGYGGAHYG